MSSNPPSPLPLDIYRHLASTGSSLPFSLLNRQILSATSPQYLQSLCSQPITPKEVEDYLLTLPSSFGFFPSSVLYRVKEELRHGNVMDRPIYLATVIYSPTDINPGGTRSLQELFATVDWIKSSYEEHLDLLSIRNILRRRLGCVRRFPTYVENRLREILFDTLNSARYPEKYLYLNSVVLNSLFFLTTLTPDQILDQLRNYPSS